MAGWEARSCRDGGPQLTGDPDPTAGWNSDFPEFRRTPAGTIRSSLEAFVRDPGPAQIRAWDDSIPLLQREAGEILALRETAPGYGAILEYRLPLELRRPDAVLLADGAVVVLELKGKESPSQADLDQAAAYARDLRAYHAACRDRPVAAVLVPTGASPVPEQRDGVHIVGPAGLDQLVSHLATLAPGPQLTLAEFLDPDAYRPLPDLVEAARELFLSRTVRDVWRAKANTDPAVEAIAAIAHEAARDRRRHLVLVTGVPGAGKTLVGMRAVHARFLDDLAVPRRGGKPVAPALYLSGNGPLCEVLQYEFRRVGGGGKAFVRHIKGYLDHHVTRPERVPREHLLVFDEAQRAFSADKVADTHRDWDPSLVRSEPALFVGVCERMPEWSVLVGLIGGGQEIHLGEEEGLAQWRRALEESPEASRWTVHAPAGVEEVFAGSGLDLRWNPALSLDTAIRFHLAGDLHRFVEALLGPGDASEARRWSAGLWSPRDRETDGLRLWATRDLEEAKAYLRDRYAEDPGARYGILASSRDKRLPEFGLDNSYMGTKNLKVGPWFTEGPDHPMSSLRLDRPATEFQAQGLELDMALVAWGTDFLREKGAWTNRLAAKYGTSSGKRTRPRDPFRMRQNAYRVLLTRGRDGTVVFVPPVRELDGTWEHLLACGFRELEA
ncbi:MAG: DUF2075 domain-containing protein [Planctomycetaceae bacterium]|nr:DUF2075 domain-containing protein [Planctomycetota bacterium]NUN51681.1 DUF2075 domain-containing protein [Planctomycetaceae bacterium]